MQVLSQKLQDIDTFRASLRVRSYEGAKDVEQCARLFGNTLGGFPAETERNQQSVPLTYFLRKLRTMNMFMFLPFLAMTGFAPDAITLSIAILIVTILIWNSF